MEVLDIIIIMAVVIGRSCQQTKGNFAHEQCSEPPYCIASLIIAKFMFKISSWLPIPSQFQ